MHRNEFWQVQSLAASTTTLQQTLMGHVDPLGHNFAAFTVHHHHGHLTLTLTLPPWGFWQCVLGCSNPNPNCYPRREGVTRVWQGLPTLTLIPRGRFVRCYRGFCPYTPTHHYLPTPPITPTTPCQTIPQQFLSLVLVSDFALVCNLSRVCENTCLAKARWLVLSSTQDGLVSLRAHLHQASASILVDSEWLSTRMSFQLEYVFLDTYKP